MPTIPHLLSAPHPGWDAGREVGIGSLHFASVMLCHQSILWRWPWMLMEEMRNANPSLFLASSIVFINQEEILKIDYILLWQRIVLPVEENWARELVSLTSLRIYSDSCLLSMRCLDSACLDSDMGMLLLPRMWLKKAHMQSSSYTKQGFSDIFVLFFLCLFYI